MSVVAVSRLHHLMRSYQIHAIGRQPVMLDERVLLNVLFDLAFTLRLGRMLHFLPVFDAALDENGQGRCADHPVAAHRDAIQPAAVGEARRKKRDLLKVFSLITQAFHHAHKQFRMRVAKR